MTPLLARCGLSLAPTMAMTLVSVRILRRSASLACVLMISEFHLVAEAAGEVLDELPGDPAGAGAARHRPFIGFGAQLGAIDLDADRIDIAFHDREIGVLIAIVETDPKAEAVAQGDLLFDRFGGI